MRTASVEVASSWSAMRTRAALTAEAARNAGRSPQPVGQPRRDRCGAVSAGRRRYPPHRPGRRRRALPSGSHGVRPQVRSERIGGPTHHQGPAHPLERVVEGAVAEVRGRPVTVGIRLPEKCGDLLDGHVRGQRGCRTTPVERTLVEAELGHAGGDGGQPALGLTATPAAGGEALDVGDVEEAAPAGGSRCDSITPRLT